MPRTRFLDGIPLDIDALEGRESPTITLAPDATVPADWHAALAVAGRYVSQFVADDTVISVTAEPLDYRGDGRVAESRVGQIAIDPTFHFFTGVAPVGIPSNATDLVSIAEHEILHELGYRAHLPQVPQVLGDGHFGVGPLLQGYLYTGRRYQITTADLDAVAGAGATVVRRPSIDMLSVAGPDGVCRQYAVLGGGLAVHLADTGRTHVTVYDFDADGAPDLRLTPSGFGIDVAVSGRDGAVMAWAVTTGVPAVYARY